MAAGQGRSPGRRATIREVAQKAGVSVGTVSHVMNDSKSVSEQARGAVLRAVTDLNERPNSLARSLIARRHRTVAPTRPGRPRLISVGYVSINYIVRIDRVRQSGERATSRSTENMLGGPSANVAAFAAALGPPFEISAEIVTHMGNDADSLWALEELASRKIDASGALQQPGGRLSRCIVLVEGDGQRTIVNEPFQVPLDFLARHLAQRAPDAAPACVHCDGFHLSAAEHEMMRIGSPPVLLCIGDIDMDIIMKVPHPPGRDQKVVGRQVARSPGGMAANVAVGARRLGTPTRMLGAVGDDAMGGEARDALEREALYLAHVARRQGAATFFGIIMVDDEGEKSLVKAVSPA